MANCVGKTLILFAIFSPLVLRAQDTAEVRGRVFDSARHAVTSAFVIITGKNTSLMRAATTNDDGSFAFPSLPVGNYVVEVHADGYSIYSRDNVRATIGSVTKFDITLGQSSAVATPLPASSPLIESENTQLGVVMGEGEAVKLPLKSRDTLDLLQLQPGVQSTLGTDLFYGSEQPGVVSVSGGRAFEAAAIHSAFCSFPARQLLCRRPDCSQDCATSGPRVFPSPSKCRFTER